MNPVAGYVGACLVQHAKDPVRDGVANHQPLLHPGCCWQIVWSLACTRLAIAVRCTSCARQDAVGVAGLRVPVCIEEEAVAWAVFSLGSCTAASERPWTFFLSVLMLSAYLFSDCSEHIHHWEHIHTTKQDAGALLTHQTDSPRPSHTEWYCRERRHCTGTLPRKQQQWQNALVVDTAVIFNFL